MNRLKLDFSLETTKERNQFVKEYTQKKDFEKYPLTEEELETCANYILWGKDEDGKNVVQKKEIQIETRNKTWNKKEEESLNELLEMPTFNESLIIQPFETPTKIPKQTFSRKKALARAPDSLKETFIYLFKEIDETDLILNYYDLAHGKRKNPPREELLSLFSLEEQKRLLQKSQKLNPYKYLKLRHHLVELRRQQFTLKDTYTSTIQRDTIRTITEPPSNVTFDFEIPVFPLGLFNNQEENTLIFREKEKLNPTEYSIKELKKISKYYWHKIEERKEAENLYFDFTNLEHVYNAILSLHDLEDSSYENSKESTTNFFIKTLKYYIDFAELSDIHKEILTLKIAGAKNQKIADIVNNKYQKSYTINYISTIFRQKIIKQINDAAAYHELIISSLFFPEMFKVCNKCRKVYLIEPKNFVRKSRSPDGFSNRCKICDKKDRAKRREENETTNL